MSRSSEVPPFPENLLAVPLKVISYAKLLAADQNEEKKLFQASKELGFFYLDLQNASEREETLLSDVDHLFTIAPQLFAIPQEEKEKYDLTKNNAHGLSVISYKTLGQSNDRKGTPDETEFIGISKDNILSQHPLFGPTILQSHRSLLRRYVESAHAVHTVILQALSNQLGLSPKRSLINIHRMLEPSGDQIRITYAPPSSGIQSDDRAKLGEHTDFGSLTLLFNRLGGLQVRPPGQVAWHYVRPMKGHAIVNLGDAMVKFTNGLLKSNIHRVVSPPGLQALLPRVSIVYFMRPEDDAKLKRLDGSDLIPALGKYQVEEDANAKEWIQRRMFMRMKGFFTPESWDQTLGTEVKASL